MLIDAVQRAVLCQQTYGGFFADAFHAGDIIRGVPYQRLVIDDLFRQDAELALDIFRKVVFAGVGFAVGEGNYHAVGHQLQQVAVSGDYLNAQPFFPRRPDCQAADDVIRFVVFQFQPGNIEGIHHLADALHLPAQVFGHFGASALVFRIEVVSEGAAGIERDSQIVGLVLFQDAQQGVNMGVGGVLGFDGEVAA